MSLTPVTEKRQAPILTLGIKAMSRFLNPIPQYAKANGDLLAGGTITFYASGTDTLLPIFGDVNEEISIANPVFLGDRGQVPNIFFSASARAVLADAEGVQIFDVDPISAESGTAAFEIWQSNLVYSLNNLVFGADGQPYISLRGGNQGNDPTVTPDSNQNWSQLNQIRVWNADELYGIDILVIEDGTLYKSANASNINNRPSTDNGSNWQAITAANGLTFDNTVSGLSATDVQAAIDEINSILEGSGRALNYEGSLDLTTGDPALPVAPSAGDTYTVSTGGTITVSRNGNPATSQVVNAGETIVYNGTEMRWDVVPSANAAVAISYSNINSQLASQNVQAAIDELTTFINSNVEAIVALQGTAGAQAGGLIYRGQLNVSSGDISLPASKQVGDLYQISVGGTITVSTDGNVPAPTLVEPRDQIIWNELLNRWDRTVAPPIAVIDAPEQSITLTQPLTLAALKGQARWYPPNDVSIIGIRAAVGTAPAGSNIVINVLKNSMLQETLNIIDGSNTSAVLVPTTPFNLAVGDYITVDVIAVGTGTPGANLTVTHEYIGT